MKLTTNITDWLEVSGNVNFQSRSDGDLALNEGSTLANSPFANSLRCRWKPCRTSHG